jgi:CheY-like chemotaxis protein
MLSKATSVPIVSCFDGKSAVDLISSSRCEDFLLFLMDWHMPGICGLTATDAIRRIAEQRGGPKVFVIMVTADIEGLRHGDLYVPSIQALHCAANL